MLRQKLCLFCIHECLLVISQDFRSFQFCEIGYEAVVVFVVGVMVIGEGRRTVRKEELRVLPNMKGSWLRKFPCSSSSTTPLNLLKCLCDIDA